MNIAFFGYDSLSWMGGINYLKNLLLACKASESPIQAYIFLRPGYDKKIPEIFEGLGNCIVLEKKSLIPLIFKIVDRLFLKKTSLFYNYYLNKYSIDFISHSDISQRKLKARHIGWIPDFQHIHLPELFSSQEISKRNLKYKKIIHNSEFMIASSKDAAKDIVNYYPEVAEKVRILHFVSEIDSEIYQLTNDQLRELKKKYGFKEKFFYVPNKFYRHKNHLTLFAATKLLKEKGKEIQVLCSGSLSVWESQDHIDQLFNYIKQNNLEQNIKILGNIEYKEVQILLRYSLAVINPSLFEGWSTTVEECKSLGKNMILSDISVHKEQNPPYSVFFNPEDPHELSILLEDLWQSQIIGPDLEKEKIARNAMMQRMISYGNAYYNILKHF